MNSVSFLFFNKCYLISNFKLYVWLILCFLFRLYKSFTFYMYGSHLGFIGQTGGQLRIYEIAICH